MIEHSKQYSTVIKNFLTRHKCNPGITGWAQVNGFRGATNDDLMKKRMDYDVWYLKNWSLGLDFLIMLKTVYAIIKYRAD
jgi:lipopolysaccharide/colanic/teichoic acid biosynthesis glycosyltransferase